MCLLTIVQCQIIFVLSLRINKVRYWSKEIKSGMKFNHSLGCLYMFVHKDVGISGGLLQISQLLLEVINIIFIILYSFINFNQIRIRKWFINRFIYSGIPLNQKLNRKIQLTEKKLSSCMIFFFVFILFHKENRNTSQHDRL